MNDMNMHSDFSEWFLAAGIELQNDALVKRWAGVEAFAAGRDEIASLVEIFFGFYDGKEPFLVAFRAPFQKADAAFRMKDNNQEVSVLAGAKLVSVIESDSIGLGNLAALALVSCAAQNLRAPPCVSDIPVRAAKHLNRSAVNRSQLETDADSEDDESSVEIKQLQRDLAVIGEESNVLWWVFGESSRDTNKRWSDCTVAQTALMAGKELADLTRIAPGPAAAGALLDRVVKNAKQKPPPHVLVKDAIGELPVDWRLGFAKHHGHTALVNLCPVSQAIKMSTESVNGDAWIQALPKATKIRGGGKIAPHLLAYQIFLECLLTSLWSKVE